MKIHHYHLPGQKVFSLALKDQPWQNEHLLQALVGKGLQVFEVARTHHDIVQIHLQRRW